MTLSGILKVTDGTNSVSFLAKSTGVILQEWQSGTHQAKGGAVWSSSQFSDGRQMVMRNWDNMIETFDVNITGADMDGGIAQFRKLLGLLVMAGMYWTSDYQLGTGSFVHPVWIEARGDCETETRYAYIYDGTIPSLSNSYTEPFRNVPSTTETLPVIIEHGIWRDTPPGATECLHTYSYVEAPGGTEQIFYPAQNSDTVSADAVGMALSTNDLYQEVQSLGGGPSHAGLRFTNVTIAQGATITNAYIKWVSNYNTAGGETEAQQSTIYGELAANAATYANYADFAGRVDTVAFDSFALDWSQPTVVGQTFYIYNISSIVQEIVNQGGWASGNAMAFKVYSPAAVNTLTRDFAGFNDPTYDMPELHISYEIPDAIYGIYLPVCLNNYAVGYNVEAQIEHVAIYDASTGVYGPNILTTQPSSLFSAGLGVGDRLFIGSSYPFSNTVFNLVNAGDGTVTYTYKYSTAGGIAAGALSNVVEYPFGFFDGLANTGFMASIFTRPTDWAKNQVAPVLPNLYWIVIEITNVAVPPGTLPVQQTQPIYTTAWPFWEIDEDEIGGDIPALLKFLLVQIETLDGAGDPKGAYNHLLIGTRHYDRGADYTPYLNVQANKSGISFAAAGGAATVTNNSLAPSGATLNYTVAVATANATIGTWTLTGSSLIQQYYGRYRVFVRVNLTVGNPGEIGFSVQLTEPLANDNVLLETDTVYNEVNATGYDLIDLGYIAFQNSGGLVHSELDLVLQAVTTDAVTVDVLDLILFPVDETAVELYINDDTTVFDYQTGADYPGYQPLHDSTMPKEGPYSGVVDENDNLVYSMTTKVLGPATVPNKTRTRIFFLPWSDESGALKGTESLFDAWFERVLQFLNMRGNE